jgi:hypothetical protein
MGYSHYWDGSKSSIGSGAAWGKAIIDCTALIDAGKSQFELDIKSDIESLWFNGNEKKGHDHEDWVMYKDPDVVASQGFGFCKTAAKPYDTVVVACLAVLAEAGLHVSSDGSKDDWGDGIAFARDVLKRDVKMPAKIRD